MLRIEHREGGRATTYRPNWRVIGMWAFLGFVGWAAVFQIASWLVDLFAWIAL
jgi:hypothetical protein